MWKSNYKRSHIIKPIILRFLFYPFIFCCTISQKWSLRITQNIKNKDKLRNITKGNWEKSSFLIMEDHQKKFQVISQRNLLHNMVIHRTNRTYYTLLYKLDSENDSNWSDNKLNLTYFKLKFCSIDVSFCCSWNRYIIRRWIKEYKLAASVTFVRIMRKW